MWSAAETLPQILHSACPIPRGGTGSLVRSAQDDSRGRMAETCGGRTAFRNVPKSGRTHTRADQGPQRRAPHGEPADLRASGAGSASTTFVVDIR